MTEGTVILFVLLALLLGPAKMPSGVEVVSVWPSRLAALARCLSEAAVSGDVQEVDGVHYRPMDTIGGVVAVARRTRRFWSEEEKRRIVAQTYAPGVSVSQVGRRYDVNANLIFTWCRDPL